MHYSAVKSADSAKNSDYFFYFIFLLNTNSVATTVLPLVFNNSYLHETKVKKQPTHRVLMKNCIV